MSKLNTYWSDSENTSFKYPAVRAFIAEEILKNSKVLLDDIKAKFLLGQVAWTITCLQKEKCIERLNSQEFVLTESAGYFELDKLKNVPFILPISDPTSLGKILCFVEVDKSTGVKTVLEDSDIQTLSYNRVIESTQKFLNSIHMDSELEFNLTLK